MGAGKGIQLGSCVPLLPEGPSCIQGSRGVPEGIAHPSGSVGFPVPLGSGISLLLLLPWDPSTLQAMGAPHPAGIQFPVGFGIWDWTPCRIPGILIPSRPS